MEVLGGKAERGEFRHCSAVVVVSALAITEVKITNSGSVLLNTSELRHIGRRFLMAHIYAVSVLLFQDPMHIVGILIQHNSSTTFSTPHPSALPPPSPPSKGEGFF